MSVGLVYTANQPLMFPAIYMIERYLHCNKIVVMQEAQYEKRGHQSRFYLRGKDGRQIMVVVPLEDRSHKPLNEVRVFKPMEWTERLEKTLSSLYGKFEYFRRYGPKLIDELEVLVVGAHDEGGLTLEQLGNFCIRWAVKTLELPCQVHDSLQLIARRPSDPSQWIAELGGKLRCTDYIAGKVAMDAYLNHEFFQKEEIKVHAQQWLMTPYRNLGGMEVDANTSFLDALFVHGPDGLREIITEGAEDADSKEV